MSLHLITGYAGEAHITSADQGAYNMGTYGEGEFVLKRGNKFAATVVSANSITIADGEAMMQGRFIKLAAGTTESVTIDNGTQGMNRKDIICIHYERDSGTGVESASFVVKKGTESSGTPADPSYTTGDITDGNDLVNEMPLYRVNLSGLTISSIDTMYSLKVSMVDYMDNYQLPVASESQLGGVKIGSNLNMSSGNILSVPNGSSYTKGVVKAGNNVTIENGVIGVPFASTVTAGVMKLKNGVFASTSDYGFVPVISGGEIQTTMKSSGVFASATHLVDETISVSYPSGESSINWIYGNRIITAAAVLLSDNRYFPCSVYRAQFHGSDIELCIHYINTESSKSYSFGNQIRLTYISI